MKLPREIISEAVRILKESYEIDEAYALEVFLAEAYRSPRFTDYIEKKEIKNFTRWRVFQDVIKRCKRKIYYDRRKFTKYDFNSVKNLLDELKTVTDNNGFYSEKSLQAHIRILQAHISTRERVNFLGDFYSKIFRITGKPHTILDISAGHNPFSLPWMNFKQGTYLATETNTKTIHLLKEYFSKIVSKHLNVKGHVVKLDLRRLEFSETGLEKALQQHVTSSQDVDVTFLMKTLHFVDRLKRGNAEKLLKQLPSKYIVITEPTVSLVKHENIKMREIRWIKRLLSRCSLKVIYSSSFPNEILYVTTKP